MCDIECVMLTGGGGSTAAGCNDKNQKSTIECGEKGIEPANLVAFLEKDIFSIVGVFLMCFLCVCLCLVWFYSETCCRIADCSGVLRPACVKKMTNIFDQIFRKKT